MIKREAITDQCYTFTTEKNTEAIIVNTLKNKDITDIGVTSMRWSMVFDDAVNGIGAVKEPHVTKKQTATVYKMI